MSRSRWRRSRSAAASRSWACSKRRTSGSILPLLFGCASIVGIGVGHRRALEDMVRAVDRIGLKPVIDFRYSFAELPKAMTHLRRGAFGKVVVQVRNSGTAAA
jgi:NADPH:quinone reductase-like Zn-dependent oxidoreductase